MASLTGALRGQTKRVIYSGTKFCEVEKKNAFTLLSKAILNINRNADLTVIQFWVSFATQRKQCSIFLPFETYDPTAITLGRLDAFRVKEGWRESLFDCFFVCSFTVSLAPMGTFELRRATI
jgi:hypothetical protein